VKTNNTEKIIFHSVHEKQSNPFQLSSSDVTGTEKTGVYHPKKTTLLYNKMLYQTDTKVRLDSQLLIKN